MKNTQKGFLLIVIALGLIGGGAYYYVNHTSKVGDSPAGVNESGSDLSTVTSSSESDEDINIVATTTVTAYITAIEGNKIILDYFDLLGGKEAEDAKITDGLCTREEIDQYDCFPNGTTYDRNVNPKLRTFTVSPDVKITTAYAFEKTPTGIINISMQELKKDFVDKDIDVPNKITINVNGEVVEIEQIFRP